jgi:hypothetical protein
MSKCLVPAETARESFRAGLPNAPARRPGGRRSLPRRDNRTSRERRRTRLSAPRGKPSLVPSQVREIPFSGPASLPDVSWTKPAKNSPSSQCPRTTVVLNAFGAVERTSRRFLASRAVDPRLGGLADECSPKPVPFRQGTQAHGRARPTMSLGRKPEAPGEPQSRIARRQLQLPRARAFGRKRNGLGQGRPRLCCPRGNDL